MHAYSHYLSFFAHRAHRGVNWGGGLEEKKSRLKKGYMYIHTPLHSVNKVPFNFLNEEMNRFFFVIT